MPRFVLLEHDQPSRHWDLMLEVADTLRTWRLADPIAMDVGPEPPPAIACESIPDHRRAYLDFEGPVTGNRGMVRRILAGTWQAIRETPDQLEAWLCTDDSRLRVTIRPPRGPGQVSLRRE